MCTCAVLMVGYSPNPLACIRQSGADSVLCIVRVQNHATVLLICSAPMRAVDVYRALSCACAYLRSVIFIVVQLVQTLGMTCSVLLCL